MGKKIRMYKLLRWIAPHQIKKAIKEFGKENFEKIILYNLDSRKEMLEKEKELREYIRFTCHYYR